MLSDYSPSLLLETANFISHAISLHHSPSSMLLSSKNPSYSPPLLDDLDSCHSFILSNTTVVPAILSSLLYSSAFKHTINIPKFKINKKLFSSLILPLEIASFLFSPLQQILKQLSILESASPLLQLFIKFTSI